MTRNIFIMFYTDNKFMYINHPGLNIKRRTLYTSTINIADLIR
jgi:hypothetical protein